MIRRRFSRAVCLPALLVLAWSSAFGAGPNLPRVRVAPDGSGFVTADGKPFVPFGLTYFRPGTGWAPQVWKQFDAEATRADFQKMKAMGVTVIRVFLSFGSFAPEEGKLSPDGLAKLDRFLELAEEAGLYVHPTGLDHWEGQANWVRGDRFADEKLLAAQEAFWAELATRYRGRGVIWAYDLLNEPSIGWDGAALRTKWNEWLESTYKTPPAVASAWGRDVSTVHLGDVSVPANKDAPGSRELLDYQHFRESIADTWVRRQVAAIKKADPDALVTVGSIQWAVPINIGAPAQYAAFRPDRQAKLLDFSEIHFYPLDHGAYQYESPEAEHRNLAYLKGVVDAVASAGKPVVLAEFGWYGGGSPSFTKGGWRTASEEDQARWCRLAVETTKGHAIGWLNWGLYDHPEARDVTQLSGLWTSDGNPKAWGRTFTELSAQFREEPPRFQRSSRPSFDWDACLTSAEARAAARSQLDTDRR